MGNDNADLPTDARYGWGKSVGRGLKPSPRRARIRAELAAVRREAYAYHYLIKTGRAFPHQVKEYKALKRKGAALSRQLRDEAPLVTEDGSQVWGNGHFIHFRHSARARRWQKAWKGAALRWVDKNASNPAPTVPSPSSDCIAGTSAPEKLLDSPSVKPPSVRPPWLSSP